MEKKRIISIAAGIFGVLLYFSIRYALPPVLENIKINNYLKNEAETENSKCPYTVAEGLVMEKVSFVKDKKMIFEVRFLDYSKSDFDIEEFKTNVTQAIINELGQDASLDVIKNKNVVIEYVYLDSQYEEIARIKLLFNDQITTVD